MKKHFALNFTPGLNKAALWLLIVYFVSITLLSVSIFLRLQVLPSICVKYSNIAFYMLNYHVIALFSLAWLLWLFYPSKKQSKIKQILLVVSFELLLILIFLLLIFISILGMLPEYAILPVPIILVFFVYMVKHKPQRFSKRVTTPVLTMVMLLSIWIPYLTTFACYNNILSQASALSNPEKKATFISQYVYYTTVFDVPYQYLKEYLRANMDFQRYLLVGVGACGELAMATVTYLRNLDFEARKVGFPGEDHAFVEVKINGEWQVLDPGYYPSENLTRRERAQRRLTEFGAISYVIAYVNSSFVELTQYYVPTDTIIIKITREGEPFTNAEISLRHKFMSKTLRLPSANISFRPDGNGTITLHLGALNYNSKANEVEPYFWIYVNGQNTGHNVISTGTGQTNIVEIDLTG